MPPDKLIALTHCIRQEFADGIASGNLASASLLMAQRSGAVKQMVEIQTVLTNEEREAIRRADELLLATLNARKDEISARIRANKVTQRVKRTYHCS